MSSHTGDYYQSHQDHYVNRDPNLDPELFSQPPSIRSEPIIGHFGPDTEPRYHVSSPPTHLLWCFKVREGIQAGQALTTRDIETELVPNTDERFRKMLEWIDDLGPYKAPKQAIKDFEALRSDLQRLHIIKKCKEAELKTPAAWSVAGINTEKRTRRIRGKQIRETYTLQVMLKREPNSQDSISIFSHMPKYTDEQIEQMEWDVPGAPRTEMRELGQCLHCAVGKKKCSNETRCSECEKKKLPCIPGKVWSINVFAYGAPNPANRPQVSAKRSSPSAELPKSSPSLLSPIEYMPVDINVRKAGGGPLAQLDLLFTTAMNEAFSTFLKPIGVPHAWRDGQNFVLQHRGPLYVLLESNFILANSHLIPNHLEEGNRSKYIHELRAKCGQAVLAELKGLLERRHLAIIMSNIPWCSDLVTYIMLVLKAASELDDSINTANAKEIKADIHTLQQALCFFMRDLGASAFGARSPFLKQFKLTKNGVSMGEAIWAVLSKEKSRTLERLTASSFTPNTSLNLFKDSLSGLDNEQFYAVLWEHLRTHLDNPSSISSSTKMQRAASGAKHAKSPSRIANIQACLEVIFHVVLPFRRKNPEVNQYSNDPSSAGTIDPISMHALSVSDHTVRGSPTRVPKRQHPDGAALVLTMSDNPVYRRRAEIRDVFVLKSAHLLCTTCYRSYAIHGEEVYFECEGCCHFSIGWFYHLVDTKGCQLVGDVRPGMNNFDDLVPNFLVSSGRVKTASLPSTQPV
ncbi:hypothetical protein L207DRAFT_585527 [Hyaloscypha variabilis F]|uniref:Uncharacterized protein n=1 Tax=Hyaloscypha variabilis (strain UAMH 11265 / GT02V1 / F) TaxID=1149755 RepID=A0A2J6RF76_HYAVF|nr:hypothetical protein L207DRAFT_585527 [Hyaloscypha variabilis F]